MIIFGSGIYANLQHASFVVKWMVAMIEWGLIYATNPPIKKRVKYSIKWPIWGLIGFCKGLCHNAHNLKYSQVEHQ